MTCDRCGQLAALEPARIGHLDDEGRIVWLCQGCRPAPIVIATTDFVDEHLATCPEARCWLCTTYQRTMPDEYPVAIRRWQARFN